MKDTSLRDELNRRMAHLSYAEALLLMGYLKPRQKQRERLRNVLNDSRLGLDAGAFDMTFSDRDFLLKLCEVLGVDRAWAEQQVDALDADRLADKQAFKPFVLIDTGFKRSDRPGCPLFALSLMQAHRYIEFESDFWRLPLHEQMAEARAAVREHHQAVGGELALWGKIRHYLFYYSEGQFIMLDTQGHPVDEQQRPASHFTVDFPPTRWIS